MSQPQRKESKLNTFVFKCPTVSILHMCSMCSVQNESGCSESTSGCKNFGTGLLTRAKKEVRLQTEVYATSFLRKSANKLHDPPPFYGQEQLSKLGKNEALRSSTSSTMNTRKIQMVLLDSWTPPDWRALHLTSEFTHMEAGNLFKNAK